jgi:NADPH2:quinone reductase
MMSRVVRFHQTGGPDVLQIEMLEVASPGPGEVRIRVHALGLNRSEARYRSGAAPVSRLPAVLGLEAAGEIESVGPGVSDFSIGDAVSIIPTFPVSDYGMYGELVLVPDYAVCKHPQDLSWSEAAAFWVQYLTAYGALVPIGKVRPGDAVVITAASSSVGLAAIQLVNMLGGTPIGVTRSRSKRSALERAGAAHVIVSDEADLVQEIMHITGGLGVRVVFDSVAGSLLNPLTKVAADHGIIFLYGALSDTPSSLPVLRAVSKNLTVRAYNMYSVTSNPSIFAEAQSFLFEAVREKALRPVIDRTFELAEIVEAHRHLESNSQVGKIIVTTRL